jgi:hypothetical protein
LYAKKNYFLSVSIAAVATVAVESIVATVESTAVSAVLEVQAAKEATHATKRIAITFFIVFFCGVYLRFETHCKFKIILRYDASVS